MKKILISALLALSLGLPAAGSAADNDIKVRVDGTMIAFPDAKPFVAEARTMVPVRFISERLGAAVQWDGATRTVKMDKGGKQIALRIGEKKATVAGKQITFDAAASIKDSRTFVPLRFISEAYGAQVQWLASERLVEINTKAAPIKDASGKDFPVNNKDPRFQAFHKSLKIKGGVLSGTVPENGPGLYVGCEIRFKDGHKPIGTVVSPGESFSFKVEDLVGIAIVIIDQSKKQELAAYAYRSLPSLNPEIMRAPQ